MKYGGVRGWRAVKRRDARIAEGLPPYGYRVRYAQPGSSSSDGLDAVLMIIFIGLASPILIFFGFKWFVRRIDGLLRRYRSDIVAAPIRALPSVRETTEKELALLHRRLYWWTIQKRAAQIRALYEAGMNGWIIAVPRSDLMELKRRLRSFEELFTEAVESEPMFLRSLRLYSWESEWLPKVAQELAEVGPILMRAADAAVDRWQPVELAIADCNELLKKVDELCGKDAAGDITMTDAERLRLDEITQEWDKIVDRYRGIKVVLASWSQIRGPAHRSRSLSTQS